MEGDSAGVAYWIHGDRILGSVTRYSLFQPGQPFDTSFTLSHDWDTSVRGTIGANIPQRRQPERINLRSLLLCFWSTY